MWNFLAKFVLFVIFLPVLVCSQISVKLPSELVLIVNGKEHTPTENWTDSLLAEADNGNLKYEIVSAYRYGSRIETKLYIPPFYDSSRVFRQIIFYYAMLGDDKLRESEHVLVYPYYADSNDTPWMLCNYKANGRFNIQVNRWNPSPPPAAPTPEEKYIYNEIIQCLLEFTPEAGEIPQTVFNKVAEENNLSGERTREIYQNVKLWHLAD